MRISWKKKLRKSGLQHKFYKYEKHDIEDPAWENIKKLITDEEIEEQVKACWKSETIHDPNKNLTFHSYRWKQLQLPDKRKASCSPEGPPDSKRRRICTIDNEIKLLEQERENEANVRIEEMDREMKWLSEKFFRKEMKLNLKIQISQSQRHLYRERKMRKLKKKYKKYKSSIIKKFQEFVDEIDSSFLSKICRLRAKQSKNFQSFYNEGVDLTGIRDSELQELNEMKNIYELLNNYYK